MNFYTLLLCVAAYTTIGAIWVNSIFRTGEVDEIWEMLDRGERFWLLFVNINFWPLFAFWSLLSMIFGDGVEEDDDDWPGPPAGP